MQVLSCNQLWLVGAHNTISARNSDHPTSRALFSIANDHHRLLQTTGVREGQRYEADIESGPTPGPTSAPEDDEDEEEELEIRRKRRMSRLFLGALWILSLSVLVVGIVASTNDRTLGGIGVWRWLIFIGLLVPIWRVSTSGDCIIGAWHDIGSPILGVMRRFSPGNVRAVFNIGYGILESLGRSRKDRILYFFLPLRIPLLNMFRWGAYTGVWGGLMRNDTGYDVFIYVLKVFIGFILLWLAKALGVGVAKAIALRFYTVQYFDRMQVIPQCAPSLCLYFFSAVTRLLNPTSIRGSQTSLEHEFYLHALATHKPLHPHRPGSRCA